MLWENVDSVTIHPINGMKSSSVRHCLKIDQKNPLTELW